MNGEVSYSPNLVASFAFTCLIPTSVPTRGSWKEQVSRPSQTLEVLSGIHCVPVELRCELHMFLHWRFLPVSLTHYPSLGTHLHDGIHEGLETRRVGPLSTQRHSSPRSPEQPGSARPSQADVFRMQKVWCPSSLDCSTESRFPTTRGGDLRRVYQSFLCSQSTVATYTFHVQTDHFRIECGHRISGCYPTQSSRTGTHARNFELFSSRSRSVERTLYACLVNNQLRFRGICRDSKKISHIVASTFFTPPYLWYTKQVLFLDLRLPWFDHGAAAETSD